MPAYAAATPRPPRTLTELEQATLLKVTGEHRDGFRDHVIFAVALGTELRTVRGAGRGGRGGGHGRAVGRARGAQGGRSRSPEGGAAAPTPDLRTAALRPVRDPPGRCTLVSAMPLLRHLAVLFAFLAAFARPAPASAFTATSPKSRVGGFEVAAHFLAGELGAASREQHQGIGAAYDENASGYRFAARSVPQLDLLNVPR